MPNSNVYKVCGDNFKLLISQPHEHETYVNLMRFILNKKANDRLSSAREWLREKSIHCFVQSTIYTDAIQGSSNSISVGYEFEFHFENEAEMMYFALAAEGVDSVLGSSLLSELHV